MPRVPQSKRQVFEQPVGNIRLKAKASDETFGGGRVAASYAKAGQAVADGMKGVARKIDDFDKTEVKKARRELQTYANQKQTEFRLLKNRQPSLSRAEFDAQWESEYSKIAGSLGNDEQRELFGEVKADFDVSRKSHYGNHQLSEAHNYQNEEDQASLLADTQSAANHYTDKVAIGGNLKAQELVFKDLALRTGDATEDEDGNIILTKDGQRGLNAVKSKTHLAVIQRAVSEGKDQIAQDYFDDIKNDKTLSIADKERMLRLTEGASHLGEAQRFVDKRMATKGMGEMIDEARGNDKFSSKTKEIVVQHIKQRFQEKKNIQVQKDQKLHEGMFKLLGEANQQRLNNVTEYTPIKLDGNPLFDAMSEDMKIVTRKYDNSLRNNELIPTSPAVYNAITVDMFNGTPESDRVLKKFIEKGPWQYRNKLNNAHYNRVESLWKSLVKEKAAGAGKLAMTKRDETRLINQTIVDSFGINPSSKDDDDVKAKYAFNSKVDAQVWEYKRLNNTEHIPRPEFERIVQTEALYQKDQIGGLNWTNNSGYRYEKLDGESFVASFDKLGAMSKNRAINALKFDGISDPTPKQILNYVMRAKYFRKPNKKNEPK